MRTATRLAALSFALAGCSTPETPSEPTAKADATTLTAEQPPAFPPKQVMAAASFATPVAIPGEDVDPIHVIPLSDGALLVMLERGPARVTRPPPDLDDVVGDLNRFARTAASDGVAMVKVYADGSLSQLLDLQRPQDQARYGLGLHLLPNGDTLAVTNLAYNISHARGFELVTMAPDGAILHRTALHEDEALKLGAFAVNDAGHIFVAGRFHADTLGQDWVWELGAPPPPPPPEGLSGQYWALLDTTGTLLWERRLPVEQVGAVSGALFGADGHPCFAASGLDKSLTVTCVSRETGSIRWSASGDSGMMYAAPWLFQHADGEYVAVWNSEIDGATALRLAVFADGKRTADYRIPAPATAEDLTDIVPLPDGYLALFEENYSGREQDIDYVHLVQFSQDGQLQSTRTVQFDRISGSQVAALDPQDRLVLLHGTYADELACFDVLLGDPRFQPAPTSAP